jgi:hypothetical protein
MPKWLKCKIEKGMFSDEFTVTVRSSAGEEIAVFVPRRSADDRTNRVQVKTFEHEGRTIAVLPDEHQSTVDVNAGDLQPA